MKAPPGWFGALAVLGAFATLRVLETVRPLRPPTQPRARRDGRNVALALIAGGALAAAQTPIIGPLARLVVRRRWGLLQRLALPSAVETFLAVVLLDYSQYLWHYLTHRRPMLWRFHEPHHVDLDLDTLTAIRFHFGELLLSVPFRAAQVLLIGVSPRALSIWQTVTTAQILFHHSNARLPASLESWLSWVIVTPRMHGIHHSIVDRERDSNWATIFSIFDRMHGTLRLDVPQESITIGVANRRDPRELTLGKVLAMPFRARRERRSHRKLLVDVVDDEPVRERDASA